ncbi:hypothetical protein D8674_000040 [Pyrus ussuriensis x Pyrus communis]|uniref:CCHC-type domain-containing protein n=1 Tax=Pyrus ussuriensis x Pyrus communis TaxID=2448454 RepID=A0A5N5F7Q5_9ROSA|nr:hypothetical protein D8674_000040 [Pyrus ussuriensis x Pyrus communis]
MLPQPEDNPRPQQSTPEEHHVDLPNVQPNPPVNAQQMAELFQAFLASQQKNQQNEEEKESEREATYPDRLLKLKPLKFCGTPHSDKAEIWIKNIKNKLDILKVPAKNQIKLATHVMEGEADSWWDTALVADENMKAVKFMLGLKDGIRRYTVGQGTKTYREIIDTAYAFEQDHLSFLKKKASAGAFRGSKGKKKVRKESGSSTSPECYTCGEFGHISPKCLKRESFGFVVVNRPQVQQRAKTEMVQQPQRNQQTSQKTNQGNQG